ncbi:MAG: MFS transporter [Francisellaceae bacterium]
MKRAEMLTLSFACLLGMVIPFGMDIYIVALPLISAQFDISPGMARNLTFLFLITASASTLIYGPLSEIIGRRKALITGMLICTLGNAISAISDSISMLLISRLIAGFGASAAPVLARVLLQDTIKDPVRVIQGFSWYALISSTSPAIAPIIGAHLLVLFGYHSNFLFLSCFSLLIIAIMLFFINESKTDPFECFSWHYFTQSLLQCLKNYRFIGFSVMASLMFAANILYLTLSPFLFQHVFHLDQRQNSWLYLINTCAIVVGSLLLRSLIKYLPAKLLIRINIGLYLLSTTFMLLSTLLSNSLILLLSGIALMALAYGVLSPSFLAAGLNSTAKYKGAASAIQTCLRLSITAIVGFSGFYIEHVTTVTLSAFLCTLSILVLLIYLLLHIRTPVWSKAANI